jgi:hypothetical protein
MQMTDTVPTTRRHPPTHRRRCPPPDYTKAQMYAPAGDTTEPFLPPTAPGQGTVQQSPGDNYHDNGQGQGYSEGYQSQNSPYPPAPAENGPVTPLTPLIRTEAHNKYTD